MVKEDSSEEVRPYEEEKKPEEMVTNLKASIRELSAKVNEQNQRKCDVKDKLQELQERISVEGVDGSVQELIPVLRSFKKLEKQESQVRDNCNAKRSALEDAVYDLAERVVKGHHDGEISKEDLDVLLVESLDHLTTAKKELAATLRDIVSLKRKIDDVPRQSELLQYVLLPQPRDMQHNALLEIKDLMLKEISLLDSIGSQFQGVISTSDGRAKLIDSMEGVMKGIQQKLGKVQLGLQEEQRLCDTSKEKYTAAAAEQRKCYTVLKAFQDECSKNDRLRSQIAAVNVTDSKEGTE